MQPEHNNSQIGIINKDSSMFSDLCIYALRSPLLLLVLRNHLVPLVYIVRPADAPSIIAAKVNWRGVIPPGSPLLLLSSAVVICRGCVMVLVAVIFRDMIRYYEQ